MEKAISATDEWLLKIFNALRFYPIWCYANFQCVESKCIFMGLAEVLQWAREKNKSNLIHFDFYSFGLDQQKSKNCEIHQVEDSQN